MLPHFCMGCHNLDKVGGQRAWEARSPPHQQTGFPSESWPGLLFSSRPTQTGKFQGANLESYAQLDFSSCCFSHCTAVAAELAGGLGWPQQGHSQAASASSPCRLLSMSASPPHVDWTSPTGQHSSTFPKREQSFHLSVVFLF